VTVSPDTTTFLGSTVVADHEAASDDLQGGVALLSLGGLSPETAVDALHVLPNGDVLFSLDSAAFLPGLTAAAADVVRFDGAAYSKEFDAAAAGIPAGANVDALTADGARLILSFDVAVVLSGQVFADEDLVLWSGSAFSLWFDGSAAGVPDTLDLDGAHLLSNGHLLLSFDGGGFIAGVGFADEDALEYDPVSGLWQPAYDGSAQHPGWVAADLDGLAATEGPAPPILAGPAGALQFSTATYTVGEGGGFATITVQRVGGSTGAVAVSYTTADGSAGAADYLTAAGTLVWADGDAADKTFAVTILQDGLPEGPESLSLILSNPGGGAVLGDPALAILTIQDDEFSVAIPTLGPLGLSLAALLLAGAGLLALRRLA
jgi:hypothetical protein